MEVYLYHLYAMLIADKYNVALLSGEVHTCIQAKYIIYMYMYIYIYIYIRVQYVYSARRTCTCTSI